MLKKKKKRDPKEAAEDTRQQIPLSLRVKSFDSFKKEKVNRM